MLSAALGGCNWYWHWPPWEEPQGVVWRDGGGAGGTVGGGGFLNDGEEMIAPTIFMIEVRLVSIEVPVGVASGSEKMWSYLDEERARAVRSATMAQNGVRLGVATAGAWPDLANVLQEMTGQKLLINARTVPPGIPLEITLKPDQDRQTIFVMASDRTPSGKDFPPGDNLLMINFSMNEMDYNKLIVTGVPLIRSKEKVMKTVNVPGQGPAVVLEAERFTLDSCTFQLTMTSGEMLVVGPGAESRRPYSVGRHFLVHQKGGLECETVLVIVPTIRRVPITADMLRPTDFTGRPEE